MEKMSPQEVVRILAKAGVTVTLEQAEEILEFLRTLANAAVNQIKKI